MDIQWKYSTDKYTLLDPVQSKLEPFIPSDRYKGSIQGYVFYNGKYGLGYYIDIN